ncbi:MAG: hypothetical protein QOF30_3571 [Acidimicrobiaceae bacterium]|jgi:uncharacterized membrane protein (DUF373 family)|nr:hypothetical protein [Acidimicrobiaceae bacterium]
MAGPGGTDSRNKSASKQSPSEHVGRRRQFHLRALLGLCEDLIHYAVAILLLALAVLVLAHTARLMVEGGATFSGQVIDGINGVLFVIIVAELIQTVMAHFEHSGFQLKPFLIIGIISAIRHILTIGARLTLGGDLPGDVFRRSQIELGVETGVVLGLAVGLLLVRIVDDKGLDEFEGD